MSVLNTVIKISVSASLSKIPQSRIKLNAFPDRLFNVSIQVPTLLLARVCSE
jgi:hypothetical protein